jgi:hypothetical protein
MRELAISGMSPRAEELGPPAPLSAARSLTDPEVEVEVEVEVESESES